MNRSPKEIVFVHPSLLGGGAERVAIALASYFVSKGYRFTFLLTKSKEISYSIPSGVEVVDNFADPSLEPLQQIRHIRRIMKANPRATFISFLPHQNMYTLLAAMHLPNKVVVSVRNDPRFDFPNSFMLSNVRNLLYRSASSIVFQTKVQKQLFPRHLQDKGKIILNPISNSVPKPFTGIRRKVIVTAGRLEEQKNHSMTVRSFAQFHKTHPDFVLEIFGEGSQEPELRQLVGDLGVTDFVYFMGFSSDVLDHMRTATAFVMSSRFEGLSNSMIEALCMGVPTVCTRSLGGGAEAVIRDGANGVLVDVDDIVAEARALCALADDVGFAHRISLQAARLRNELSLEVIGEAWERVIA